MTDEIFNRKKPLYRVFLNDDDTIMGWYYVLPDNTPGDWLSLEDENYCEAIVGLAPWLSWAGFKEAGADWAWKFWDCAMNARKATIYDGC